MESEFAALRHSDRPFAGERTVWPDGDLAASRSGQLDPGQAAADQRDPEQDALPRPEEAADGGGDELPPPVQPAALPRSGRWIALTAANAVLLFAAAAAATLVVQHYQASQTARVERPSARPGPSSPAPQSVSPTGQSQLSVDPAAASAPDEAAIVASLHRYFYAINTHDYVVYKRQFIKALRGGISPVSFSAGFGTATDSAEQLHSISVIGGGKVDAFVTFISRQPAPGRPASPTCTAWSTEFYLGKRGTRYLLVAPPQWYQVSAISCR